MEVLLVALVGAGTALATGLGVLPGGGLGGRARALQPGPAVGGRGRTLQPALEGVAAGVMLVASIVGLLVPAAEEGNTAQVVGGALAGAAFLLGVRGALRDRQVHVGALAGAGVRRSMLVFA